MKNSIIAVAVLAFLLSACSGIIDNPAEDTCSPFYEVTIPASLDSGNPGTRAVTFDGATSSGTFMTTEKVYVYNITKGNKLLSSTLSPSTSGNTCNLTGAIGKEDVSDGDELLLVYKANSLNIPHYCRFNYANQNGTQEGVVDGATAAVSASIDGGKVTASSAVFQNAQSMFRFRFSNGTDNITVSKLTIKSDKSALAYIYDPNPGEPSKAHDDILVTPVSPTDDNLYVALCIDETKADGDILTFIVTDGEGRIYKGTRAAPSGGFENGKYYYNSTAITLAFQYAKIQPTITWNSVKDGLAVEPDVNDRYNIYGPGGTGPIDISISSNGSGYQFYFNNDATVHISNNIDLSWGDDFYIFYPRSNSLTLDISGNNNTIHCLNNSASCAYGKPLKLKGNGKLSVFANNYAYCGLVSDPYYMVKYPDGTNNHQEITTELDVTNELAVEGYTVIRSVRKDNGAGIYYWTYTVAPVTP